MRIRRYSPPANVPANPQGVTVTRPDSCHDVYTGPMAALVAAGLLSPDLFPGEPGMPSVTAVLWPHGVPMDHAAGRETPGHMRVRKCPSGDFQIMLTVSQAEKARRDRDHAEWRGRDVARRLAFELAHAAQVLEPDEYGRIIERALLSGAPRNHYEAVSRWLQEGAAVTLPDGDRVSAERDVRFQAVLARIVGSAPG